MQQLEGAEAAVAAHGSSALRLNVRAVARRASAHCAGVRGIAAVGDLLISSGPDQRLNVWRVDWAAIRCGALSTTHGSSEGAGGRALHDAVAGALTFCAGSMVSVAHVYAICAYSGPPRLPSSPLPSLALSPANAEVDAASDQAEAVVTVVGHGVEVFSLAWRRSKGGL